MYNAELGKQSRVWRVHCSRCSVSYDRFQSR